MRSPLSLFSNVNKPRDCNSSWHIGSNLKRCQDNQKTRSGVFCCFGFFTQSFNKKFKKVIFCNQLKIICKAFWEGKKRKKRHLKNFPEFFFSENPSSTFYNQSKISSYEVITVVSGALLSAEAWHWKNNNKCCPRKPGTSFQHDRITFSFQSDKPEVIP